MSYSFLFTCKGYSVDVGAWESSVSLWGHLEPIKSPQRQQCGWTLNQRASSNDGVYGLCGLYSTQDLLFQQNRFVITLRNSFYNYFHEISVPSLIIVHINCKDISCLCLWEEWFIGTHCVLFLALEYSCGLHLGRVGWWLYVSWKRSKCGKRAVTKALLPRWGDVTNGARTRVLCRSSTCQVVCMEWTSHTWLVLLSLCKAWETHHGFI